MTFMTYGTGSVSMIEPAAAPVGFDGIVGAQFADEVVHELLSLAQASDMKALVVHERPGLGMKVHVVDLHRTQIPITRPAPALGYALAG